MVSKDFITCHVLDTITGRPAAGVKVTLTCVISASLASLPPTAFTAITNSDGRITSWAPDGSVVTVKMLAEDKKPTQWRLKFYTGDYFGEGKTFWPEVDLNFYVEPGEHCHVPLLLGPYSYTTYRGS